MPYTEIDLSLGLVLFLIGMGFIAGYIDAVAGGGGMIQAMALLAAGVGPVNTLATNKIVSICGTTTAVIKYSAAKTINWYLVTACLIPCLIAAAVGSKAVMLFSDKVITWLIILCIPVALAVMFFKQVKPTSDSGESRSRGKAVALLTPIAFYDGLVGPGTGTYMAIAANKGLNMRFLRATGLAKPLNLLTNLGSAMVYIWAGKVLWTLAIPMALASIVGAYWGSQSAIRYGDYFIKGIMLIMLAVMLLVNVARLIGQ